MITEYELDQQAHERTKTDAQEHKAQQIVCQSCLRPTGHYDLRGQLEDALAAAREVKRPKMVAVRDTGQEPADVSGTFNDPNERMDYRTNSARAHQVHRKETGIKGGESNF